MSSSEGSPQPVPRLPSDRLDGRHALITGAGRGLGRACALGLVQSGARVTLVARSESELARVADEASFLGGVASIIIADVTDEASVERAVEQASRAARIDVLVNAAGVNVPQPTATMPMESWDMIHTTNLRGTLLTCRAVGRRLLELGAPGRLINFSSQMGSVGNPGRAAYCASKHGVDGLTKALAVEWAPRGITVNSVAPTFIRTPLTEPMLANPGFQADVLARIPMGRVGEVEDVMGAVAFLASDRAAFVTGHVLLVDGGWVAW